MTVFTGKSVYDAAVCGLICILRKPKLSAERMHVDDISTELKRVEAARIVATEQLQQLYELFLDEIGESNAQIFNIHMMMLEDEDYNGSIEGMIRSEQVNAEYAVARTSDVFAHMLEAMDNEYMRARSADVRDVSNRLLSILTDTPMDFPWVPENSVVCADDLTPSETAALERRNIAALVTAHGSAISHTAILAHSMNIPTVIGIGDEFLANIRPGEQAFVDGFSGEVILKPDAGILSKLTAPQEKSTDTSEGTHTADGTHVSIYSVDDPCAPLPEYADGIAVFSCPLLSDETKQYEYYRAIAERTPDCRAIIRMPVISSKDPDRQIKYDQQIRAVFRAASHGEPGILFPMITSVPEARKILAACDDAKMELRAEGVKCSENVKIGFMVEIPAAAIISDCLAPMADFFIIDSDSIARHTLACYEEDCFSPDFADGQLEAVMRLIGNSARNAVKNGARIGICGSLAGDTSLTGDFLRMGIDNFCVTPDRLAEVRKRVTEVDLEV